MYNNENINFQNYHFPELLNDIIFFKAQKGIFFLLELFLVCFVSNVLK